MKNKLLTALISIAIALAVWTYVVTVVSPNSDKHFQNVPVVTQGEALLQERKLMITGTDVTATSLHLEGSRIDLNKLSSSNITVTLDVSKIYEAGTHTMTYLVSFPGDVASNAITVLGKDPSEVKVVVEERVTKAVPLEIRYNGNVAADFVADKENVEMDVKEITVGGPKSALDQITKAVIDLDLEGRNESLSEKYTYTLCDEAGKAVDAQLVTTDVAEVNLTLRIARVKEIALKLNVIDGGGATAQNSVITIDPPTILISGSDALLEGMEQLELGAVDLVEIAGDTELVFPIKLPEGITNETGVTEAKVNISFPSLATKTLTVKNISAVNVPDTVRADLITKALEIVVRGPQEKIEALTEDAITVTVDFTGVEAGTVKLKAQITCSDPEIGAVGSYSVSATVKNR